MIQSAYRIASQLITWVLAIALALAVVCDCPRAYADVRSSDVLAARTVESRGLPATACPNIEAEYAYVVDENGTVYFERDANEKTHIASITKVMTAIVALENASLDDEVTVSTEAAQIGESSAELLAGDTLTMKAALTGLMVSSGNDAAIAIAEAVGEKLKESPEEDSIDAFVAAMNEKAAELGMTNTLFANPHGLDVNDDADMYSTAHDVVLMCDYAMKNETFRDIVAQENAQLTVKRKNGDVKTIQLESTDVLLGEYEGACGIKTGFTDAAGNSFAGACERDGVLLYAIVLGSSSEEARFSDAETLFDWVYDNTLDYAFAHSAESVTMARDGASVEVPVIAEVPHTAWPDKTIKATLADPDASVTVFAPNGNISQEIICNDLSGTVNTGDTVGTINFYQNNECIASCDLVAAEQSSAPGVFEGIRIWWQRLVRNITGSDELVADLTVVNETPLIYDKSSIQPTSDELQQRASGKDVPAATDENDKSASKE